MNIFDIITIVIATAAIIVSVSTHYLFKKKSEALIKQIENKSSAIIENSVRSEIKLTTESVLGIHHLIIPINAKETKTNDEKRMLEAYNKSLDVALENNINAYERACAIYIDDKIDKTRFKKDYFEEIKKLVNCDELKEYFNAITSKYKAILKVYDEWYNLEK